MIGHGTTHGVTSGFGRDLPSSADFRNAPSPKDRRLRQGRGGSLAPCRRRPTSVLRRSACPDWRSDARRSGALALWRSGALASGALPAPPPRLRWALRSSARSAQVPAGAAPLLPTLLALLAADGRTTDPAPPASAEPTLGCWARGAAAPSAPLSLTANRSATPSQRGCLCVERESTSYFQTARSSKLDVDLRIAFAVERVHNAGHETSARRLEREVSVPTVAVARSAARSQVWLLIFH